MVLRQDRRNRFADSMGSDRRNGQCATKGDPRVGWESVEHASFPAVQIPKHFGDILWLVLGAGNKAPAPPFRDRRRQL